MCPFLLFAAVVSQAAAVQAVAAYFFYSKTCPPTSESLGSDSAGFSYLVPNGATVGGAYGARALYIIGDPSNDCAMAGLSGCTVLHACKNSVCSTSDTVQHGQCKTFENGVWAREACEPC